MTRNPFCEGLGGPQGRCGRMRKISPPPGFDPRTVQSVARRLYPLRYPDPQDAGTEYKQKKRGKLRTLINKVITEHSLGYFNIYVHTDVTLNDVITVRI
jgi:hypothetical protein